MSKHLCDVNVWLALALSEHVHHPVARDWLATVEHPRSVVLTRSAQLSLLRLLTSSAVLSAYGNAPLTNDEAWQVAQAAGAQRLAALMRSVAPYDSIR